MFKKGEFMELTQAAYTPSQTSKLFGRETTWAYRRLYDGTFKSVTIGGRKFIPAEQIAKLLQIKGTPSNDQRKG